MGMICLTMFGIIEPLTPMSDINTVIKVAEMINNRRRKELLRIYLNDSIFDHIKSVRKSGVFDEGKRQGVRMRKVASLPIEVDMFFSRVYGQDYYKDPDFFTKVHSEWRVVDANRDGGEDDFIKSVIKSNIYETR